MRATLLIVVALLLTATAASAKGPGRAIVCGRGACLTFTDRDVLLSQLVDNSGPFGLASAPRPAAFYTATFRFPGENSQYDWSYLYVPSRRMVRITSSGGESVYWRSASSPVRQAFATIAQRLRPFRAVRRWPPAR